MKPVWSLIVILLGLLCARCSNDGSSVQSWQGGYADGFGTYINTTNNSVLRISSKKELLKYVLIVKSDTVVRSNENADAYQRWFMFLDNNLTLWIRSADTGTWVWCKGPDNQYHKFDIAQRPEYCDPIPPKFLQEISN